MQKWWNNTSSKPYIWGVFLVVLGSILFAGKAIIAKLLYNHYQIDSTLLVTLRMLFALPFYLITLFVQNKKYPIRQISANNWSKIVIAGTFGYYLASFFDFWGLEYVTASIERLVIFSYPTLVIILSYFFLKKPITKPQIIALIICYCGIGISFFPEITSTNNSSNLVLGIFLVFMSAFTYAIYLIINGSLTISVNGGLVTSLSMIISTFFLLSHFLILGDKSNIHLEPLAYWSILAMSIFCTVVPSYMITEGIRRIGSSNASIIGSIGPVATIFFAIIFLGETLNIFQILGSSLIIYGVLQISQKG